MAPPHRPPQVLVPSDAPADSPAVPPRQAPARRRRRRLARGPVVIGEPSAAVEAQLAACDPYRADTIADGGTAFGLTVRAASIRGLSKRWSGEPRQDDICLFRHDPTDTLVAAVADGVSGATRSHLGAALAVRHAVACVARQLDKGAALDWQEIFSHAAWSLVEAERTAAGDQQIGVEQASRALATTLLVAVVSGAGQDAAQPAYADEGATESGQASSGDEGAAAAQPVTVELACVGDSCALRLCNWRFERLLGAEPMAGALLGSAVDALPRAAGEVRSKRIELAAGEVLLLATDGFSLPLGEGDNEVGAVFARELDHPPGVIEFARLLDFSRSTYDDDRSLIAIWPPRQR